MFAVVSFQLHSDRDFTFPVTISLFRRITHGAADTRAEKAAKITRKSVAFNNYTIRSDAERNRTQVKLARVGGATPRSTEPLCDTREKKSRKQNKNLRIAFFFFARR